MPLFTYAPILQEVQDALALLSITKPTGVYDSTDEHAVVMGVYANMIGPMMVDGGEWQQFDKEFTVTGDGVQSAFPLPVDYNRFVDNTGWSLSNRRPVIVVNSQQQAAIQAWVSQSFFVNPAAIIENDTLTFLTPPGLNEVITFKYISKWWVIDGATPSILKERLETNADVPMFDSVLFTFALKLKWLELKGMPTTAAMAEFNTRLDQVMPRNAMAGTLMLNGGAMTGFRYLNGANVPDQGFGS